MAEVGWRPLRRGGLCEVSAEDRDLLVDALDAAVGPAGDAVLAACLFEHGHADAKLLGCLVDREVEVIAQSGLGNIFFMVDHKFFFIFENSVG